MQKEKLATAHYSTHIDIKAACTIEVLACSPGRVDFLTPPSVGGDCLHQKLRMLVGEVPHVVLAVKAVASNNHGHANIERIHLVLPFLLWLLVRSSTRKSTPIISLNSPSSLATTEKTSRSPPFGKGRRKSSPRYSTTACPRSFSPLHQSIPHPIIRRLSARGIH